MKKILKFIGIFLLWMIAAFILNFIIVAIAIAMNGGRPVSGADCNIVTMIIIGILVWIVHYKKKEE